jgi:cytochrome c553
MNSWSPAARAALVLFALSPAAMAEGNPEEGRWKANTCLGCHGVESYKNVYPTYHVPKIAGQHAEYIAAALKAYREGTRQHNTMHANAATLTDQDIADIAAWLASDAAILPQ